MIFLSILVMKKLRMLNEEVQSEYTPVEENEDKKHKNDPMETTTLPILEKDQFLKTSVKVSGFYGFHQMENSSRICFKVEFVNWVPFIFT